MKDKFTLEEAVVIGDRMKINWEKFNSEQFRKGLEVETEHGTINPLTNITNDDLIMTGKIALAHLIEFPDYYNRLEKMENEAKLFWGNYHIN